MMASLYINVWTPVDYIQPVSLAAVISEGCPIRKVFGGIVTVEK